MARPSVTDLAVARAESARRAHSHCAARQRFSDYTRTLTPDEMQSSLVDVVADALILAKARGLNPAAILRMATIHANI